jgi:SPP1 gp7 family putative phage head morphogenesis protein
MVGSNPKKIARLIADRVEKIGLHRATLIARTETIRAHHLASIRRYRELGITGVKVTAEWVTYGDSNVCELCSPLEGKIFTLDEVEFMIPVHPQCRCATLPYIEE